MKLTNVITGAFLPVAVFGHYTEDEFHILQSVRAFFNIAFIVFVEDEFITPEVLDAVKRSSERNIASTAVTSTQLMKILRTDNVFLRQKIMLASKKKIRLGPFLQMVPSPKLVVWALFVDPADGHSLRRDSLYHGRVFRIKAEANRLAAYDLLHESDRIFGFVGIGSTAEHFSRESDYENHNFNMSNIVVKVGISSEICRSRKDGILLEVIFCSHSHILELMVEKLNVRKEYIKYPETQYSFVYPNGSYSGYFKMVLDKEVNMSVAAFVVTSKRLEHFDFIWPTFALDTSMYLKKADIVRASVSGSPFSFAVWTIISGWIFTAGGFLFVSRYCNRECGSRRGNTCQALGSSVLKILQLMCNQGSSDDPSSSSSRILHTTSLFGGMLLYFYYSAVVLSYLTVESIDLPFTDLEGFIESKNYKIIAPAGGFVSYYIEYELTQFRHRAGKYMIRSDRLPPTIDDCVTEVCDRKSLTLLELEGTVLNLKSKCELTKVPSPVFAQFFGFALVKGFPFSEYFEIVLWRLKEIGLLTRMKKNFSWYSDVQSLDEDADYHTVALEQVTNIMIVLGFGFFLSLTILLLEFRCQQKFSERKRERAMKGLYFHFRKI